MDFTEADIVTATAEIMQAHAYGAGDRNIAFKLLEARAARDRARDLKDGWRERCLRIEAEYAQVKQKAHVAAALRLKRIYDMLVPCLCDMYERCDSCSPMDIMDLAAADKLPPEGDHWLTNVGGNLCCRHCKQRWSDFTPKCPAVE